MLKEALDKDGPPISPIEAFSNFPPSSLAVVAAAVVDLKRG